MNRTYAIIMDSKGAILDIENMPGKIARSARIAVNRAAEKARTESARRALRDIKFPAGYVSASGGRLAVTDKATDTKLSATVTARRRPTSLARFVKGSARPGKTGATVEVEPGVARFMRGARFVKLRSGSSVDTAHNLGLAIRTRSGAKPDRAYKPVRMKNGLWLLYGPSVSQALLSARDSGIWPDMTDEILENFELEFSRQMDLKNAL